MRVFQVFQASSVLRGSVMSLLLSAYAVLQSSPAWAQLGGLLPGVPDGPGTEVSEVAESIANSASSLPGLATAFAYILALIITVSAILKAKEHVEKPDNVPISVPFIRFLIGGALFAMPAVFRAVWVTITGGENADFSMSSNWGSWLSSLVGTISNYIPTSNFNNILANITDSVTDIPGLITAFAYALAIVLGFSGILKVKEHVEKPDNVALREPVIRLLAAGALFGIPTIYNAMYNTLGGDSNTWDNITSLFSVVGLFWSGYAMDVCIPDPTGLFSKSLGGSICAIIAHTGAFPAFLIAVGYVIGLVLGFWGILKIRDHVLNPDKASIWDGVVRLLAGGAFFALPLMVEVVRSTFTPIVLTGVAAAPLGSQGYNEEVPDQCQGLDGAFACMMDNLLGPIHVVTNFFAFCAGMVFIMIGISRLLKGTQEGARAPGGIGTMMTFAIGGALISYNEMIRAMTATLSLGTSVIPLTATYATLSYTDGMSPDELTHAHTVISAVVKFMIVIGIISFVRGLFIIRGVAEGNSQSSIMAGITHIVGGALAVNIGPVINMVQTTLGITTYGISFT